MDFKIGYAIENTIKREIIINIPARTLTLYEGDIPQKVYPVAVGKAATRTPIGSFSVINKLVNPYYSRGNIQGGSPQNPLGVRWIGFKPHYGIHGNSAPNSIGTTASAGCVRMFNYDVKELYQEVDYNTKVSVVYNLFDVVNKSDELLKGLIIYPDVYGSSKELQKKIIRKLEEININEDITEERIVEATKNEGYKNVVLSKQWALIINQQYFTTDTILFEEKVYVNETELSNYFGLEIEKSSNGLSINGVAVNYHFVDDKYYISMDSVNAIIGGKMVVNPILQNIWFDVAFVKLNGVFLERNDISMSVHELFVPVEKLNSIFYKENSYQGIKRINDKNYTAIENTKELFGLNYDVLSLDKKIELSIEPQVVLNEKSVSFYKDENDIYVNYAEIVNTHSENQYVRINDLEFYEVSNDKYYTKIIIKPKEVIPVNIVH